MRAGRNGFLVVDESWLGFLKAEKHLAEKPSYRVVYKSYK